MAQLLDQSPLTSFTAWIHSTEAYVSADTFRDFLNLRPLRGLKTLQLKGVFSTDLFQRSLLEAFTRSLATVPSPSPYAGEEAPLPNLEKLTVTMLLRVRASSPDALKNVTIIKDFILACWERYSACFSLSLVCDSIHKDEKAKVEHLLEDARIRSCISNTFEVSINGDLVSAG